MVEGETHELLHPVFQGFLVIQHPPHIRRLFLLPRPRLGGDERRSGDVGGVRALRNVSVRVARRGRWEPVEIGGGEARGPTSRSSRRRWRRRAWKSERWSGRWVVWDEGWGGGWRVAEETFSGCSREEGWAYAVFGWREAYKEMNSGMGGGWMEE